MNPVSPLRLETTSESEKAISALVAWLRSLSDDAARRFTTALDSALEEACQSHAEQFAAGAPAGPIDEPASLAFARPTFLRLFSTGKSRRARRQSSGTYRLYYELRDADGDGMPDALRVLTVRHAAARPLWDAEHDPDDGEDEVDDTV